MEARPRPWVRSRWARRQSSARPRRAWSWSAAAPAAPPLRNTSPRDAKGAIEVTLVEPSKQFVTCFHSNLYLGGFKSLENITHGYDKLAGAYGIKLNHQAAASIDRDKKKVRLADGADARLRPARSLARHRPQVRQRAGLGAGARGGDAARLEGRQADADPARAARRRAERRRDRHDRAAESLSLPARALRARVDDGASAQDGRQERAPGSSSSIQRRASRSRACSRKAGRSIIREWSSG